MAEAFLKTTGGDPEALLPLLGSFVDSSEDELRAIAMPTLVAVRVPRTRTTGPPRSWPTCFPTAASSRFPAII